MKKHTANGFTWQPAYTRACGVYALTHALLLLGNPVKREEVARAMGVTSIPLTRVYPITVEQVANGIRHFNCTPDEKTMRDPHLLQGEFDRFIVKGIPIILSVEGGRHFVVVSGKRSAMEYFWIDTTSPKLVGCWHFTEIIRWIERGEYCVIGVMPNREEDLCHSLVPEFSSVYNMLENDLILMEHWGDYLKDLLGAFDSPIDAKEALSSKEVFDGYGKMLIDAVCQHASDTEEERVAQELERYRVVAIAHHLTLSKERLLQTLTELTAALTARSVPKEVVMHPLWRRLLPLGIQTVRA